MPLERAICFFLLTTDRRQEVEDYVMCNRGLDFASFYDVRLDFWNRSDSVIFLGFSFYL